MKPFDEDLQEDSVRNYNAEGSENAQPVRKSFNPNFTEDNKLSHPADGQRRPRKRVGETTRFSQGTDYSNNRPYRPRNDYNQDGGYGRGGYNNRGYNNNRGGYNNNRSYNGGYNNGGYERNFDPNFNNASKFEVNFDLDENNGKPVGEGNGMPQQSYDREMNYRQDNRQFDGYNDNRGYGNNNNRRGYGNGMNRGGGYNNNRGGGYNNNRGGGYNNNRGGGYNNNRGGGYNNMGGGYNNQGGDRRSNFGGKQNRQGGKGNFQKQNLTRPIEYKSIVEDPNEEIRLNKFLANAGICSRREADELIQAGVVTVNGTVISELGAKILRKDEVKINDQLVSPDKRIYLLLNKPKDCVTTSDDPYAKTTVMDLVKNACRERIYPVGRLDRNTTGVLLLTNDGDLSAKLTHPKYNKKKIYQIMLDKPLEEEHYNQILAGIELEDGEIKADELHILEEGEGRMVGIEIHSGRNRIVRRIFEHFGYRVVRLDRVYFAGLTKKNLKRGQWRFLTEKEVSMLRMGAFE
ncbi:MAG: rRNA pseudouridine synthase [Paludibacteraceae bacterium]|nr:rRNA pseudouridine synthase [Paludibacteraceae bacterium]MEE3483212.1 pseudouridine synthase [Bacteroidales bacterium]